MLKTTQAAKVTTTSIKTKLIIAICLLMAFSIGAVSYFNLRGSQLAVAEKTEEAMLASAETAAEGIGKEVAVMKAIVELIAKEDKFNSSDPSIVVARMAEIKASMPQIENLLLIDSKGSYIGADGKSGSIADRDYFRDVLDKKTTVMSGDPVVSKFSGKLAAVAITPIKGGSGQNTRYLAAGVQIDGITNYVLNRKIGKEGYTYAFGKSGVFFIHPDEKVALKQNILGSDMSPALVELAKTALAGKKSVKEYEFNGSMKYAGSASVPGTSWGVGTTLPKEEAMAKISDLRNQAILIAFLAVLLGAILVYFIAAKLTNPIISLVGAANKIADGDLTQSVNVSSNDEIGQLSVAFNAMGSNLKNLIQQVQRNAEQMAASSEELTASSEQSAQASNQIASSISDVAAGATEQLNAANETSSVVEQMSAGIQQVAASTYQAASQSAKAADKAKEGGSAVAKAVNQMEIIEGSVTTSAMVVTKLGDRSKEIGQIVDTISGIAGQTNLLALNAAIEAARAGEQGRGFAVVAEEVRKLAEQSQEAAKKIAELIGEIQGETDKAVLAMQAGTQEVKTGAVVVHAAGVAFQEIVDLVTQVSGQVKEISASIQQMASGSQQIVGSVKKMGNLSKQSASESQTVSAATEEQLASTEEIASSSQALARLAQDLQTAVNRFQV